ncbi:MAG TPA: DUF2167 domain-containing protein [Vitreimonas sp.]|uniref:DUF2167 domain-containing protein n=1 Tax=Vitreimonas sp. TaxID=3069702 RepID=UPI002D6DAF5B|nr:DUF2167 domain-containing protein [Vitreimonas sp.]HYD86677.1 DUF2167 domain-containing protein [Vitreimonas sp.]
MRRTALITCAALVASSALAWAQSEPAVQEAAPTAPALTEGAPVEAAPAAAPPEMTAEEQEYLRQAQALYDSLDRQTGVVTIAEGRVSLNVPETHYFVGAADARRIIVDVWGNPPNSAQGVEGIIFPAGANPALDSWGAIVQYVNEGHVPDDEASTIDYNQLLRDMQTGAEQENAWRRENNYPTVTLVGWAEAPHYDPATHKLYWAKDLLFGGESVHSLNYDIRVLGREGHLVVSFVSTMDQLETIRAAAPAVMEMANFTAGNTYADYVEGVDQRAAYGIGGLIAGGALAAVAQKTGLLAMILAFGKKFIVLIIAGIVALGGAVMRMFRRDPPAS